MNHDGRKNRGSATALLLTALIFSSHFISGVLTCTNPGCQNAFMMFTNFLRLYPSLFISYSRSKILPPMTDLTAWFIDCNLKVNCSYLCSLDSIWYDLWNLLDTGNSTWDNPFPQVIYGICQYQGGANYSQCTTPSPLFCLLGKREETDTIPTPTTTSTTTTATRNDAVMPRGEWSEYGSCSAGAPISCPSNNPQCCNHAMGGQGFLCMINCDPSEVDGDGSSILDCMNDVLSNYCQCLGTC